MWKRDGKRLIWPRSTSLPSHGSTSDLSTSYAGRPARLVGGHFGRCPRATESRGRRSRVIAGSFRQREEPLPAGVGSRKPSARHLGRTGSHFRGARVKERPILNIMWYGVERTAMENELRRVVDALPPSAWAALPDGHIDFLHRGWCQCTDLSPQEGPGTLWQTAIHPENPPARHVMGNV
jgi:PAS domain-containing protein